MSTALAPPPPPTVSILKEAYRLAKRRDNVTQARLAVALGASQQAISAWLNGTRDISGDDLIRFLIACRAPQRLWLQLRLLYPEEQLRPYLTAAA